MLLRLESGKETIADGAGQVFDMILIDQFDVLTITNGEWFRARNVLNYLKAVCLYKIVHNSFYYLNKKEHLYFVSLTCIHS